MAIKSFLKGIETVEVDDGIKAYTTLKSSVIGIIGTAGKGAVNTPLLILNNRRDAETLFGKKAGDGFTLPAALSDIFDQGAATVIAVNVLDPTLNTIDDTVNVTLNPHQGFTSKGFISVVSQIHSIISLGITRVQVAGLVLTETVTIGTGSPVIAVSTTLAAKLAAGMSVTGTGIAANTTISSIAGTNVTLSAEPTASGSNVLTFQRDAVIFTPTGATSVSIFAESDTTTELTQLQINALPVNTQVRMTYTNEVVEGTDFTLDYETGTFTRNIDTGKILPGSTLALDVTRVNDEVAFNTLQNYIIGDAGLKTGMYALLSAQNKTKLTPKIIIAPGFTHQKPSPTVRSPIVTNLQILIDRLKAIAYVDCADTNIQDAVAHKSDFADSSRMVFLYPWLTQLAPNSDGVYVSRPMSSFFAGMTAWMDNTEGFWNSPSNWVIYGHEGPSQDVTFNISDRDCEANYLQMNQIGTLVNLNGWVAWSNFLADGKFINGRRIADMMNEAIVYNSAAYADRNITPSRLRNILQATAGYMGTLKENEAIIGGSVWIDPALNKKGTLTLGEAYFDYDFTTPSPLNTLTFRSHATGDYYDGIFGDQDSSFKITV